MAYRLTAIEKGDQVVSSSGPKLTVSMFCLCIFSSTFSIDGQTRSSRGLCSRSWAGLRAYVGGLGSGSGPKLAVLACLGAKVVGLGSGSGPKLTVLACLGAKAVGLGRGSGRKVALARAGKRSGQEIRPKSGPNPSGSRDPQEVGPHKRHRPPQAIFQLMYGPGQVQENPSYPFCLELVLLAPNK